MEESLRGKLLVASPALVDPNFARTVVLITEHNDEGAMGIVLLIVILFIALFIAGIWWMLRDMGKI